MPQKNGTTLLSFELSMPNVISWNGKWAGQGNPYIIVDCFLKSDAEKAKQVIDKGYYHYNFGDGWSAGVSVKEIPDRKTAAKLRKISAGFCGYDWMVRSIMRDGYIHR